MSDMEQEKRGRETPPPKVLTRVSELGLRLATLLTLQCLGMLQRPGCLGSGQAEAQPGTTWNI